MFRLNRLSRLYLMYLRLHQFHLFQQNLKFQKYLKTQPGQLLQSDR
jgi:hypothetical protein